MARTRTGLLLGFVLAITLACTNSNVVKDQSFTLPDSGWRYGQSLEGAWTTKKSIPNGKLIIRIDHTPDFGYQNLYLTGQISIDEEMIQSDTFSIQLARPNSGGWLGKRDGGSISLTDTLPYHLSLEPDDHLEFKFSQFSREEVLKGVVNLEVQLIGN